MSDPNQPNQPAAPPPPAPPPYQLPPDYQPLPQRSGLPTWAIVLIVVGVLLVVLCIVGAIGTIGALTLLGGRVSQVFSQINSGLAVPTLAPINPASALAIGKSAELPELRVTVTGARALPDTRAARPPLAGNQYWAVEVTFENTSRRVVDLSAFATSVQDAAGASYRYSSAAQRASPDPGMAIVTPLRPGEKVSGLLFYEAPMDASALFWIYQDIIGGGQAVFKIK